MKNIRHIFYLLVIALVVFNGELFAAEVTKEQIKGLDEQVQDIKKDVLSISAELNQLEEKLLYPSNTQVSFFVSIPEGSKFEPDAIELKLNGRDVAHYIYSFKEVQALQRGGVQRVFTGNVRSGEHTLEVKLTGKSGGGNKVSTGKHVVKKGVKPQFVEIRVSGSGIEFRDW